MAIYCKKAKLNQHQRNMMENITEIDNEKKIFCKGCDFSFLSFNLNRGYSSFTNFTDIPLLCISKQAHHEQISSFNRDSLILALILSVLQS